MPLHYALLVLYLYCTEPFLLLLRCCPGFTDYSLTQQVWYYTVCSTLIPIFGIFYSCNKDLENEENLQGQTIKIENL